MTRIREIPENTPSAGGWIGLANAAMAVVLIGCGPETGGESAPPAAADRRAVVAVKAHGLERAQAEPVTLESTVQLAPDVQETPFSPQIAQNIPGDAVAVWEQFDGQRYSIWGNSRLSGASWGRARQVYAAAGDGASYNPRVALSRSGRAMAVWVQASDDGQNYRIWSSRFEPAGGWGPAAPMRIAVDGPAYAPQIAMDDLGNATAVWQQSDGRQFNIWASRWNAANGWALPTRLETGRADLGAPQVTLDPLGNALAIWPQFRGHRSELWASRSAPVRAANGSKAIGNRVVWDKAVKIESVRGYAHSPHIASVAPGHASVLWEQVDGHQTRMLANHYRVSHGWRQVSQRCTRAMSARPAPASANASQGLKLPKAEWRGECY